MEWNEIKRDLIIDYLMGVIETGDPLTEGITEIIAHGTSPYLVQFVIFIGYLLSAVF